MKELFPAKMIEVYCGDKGRMDYSMRPLIVSEYIEYLAFRRRHASYSNTYLSELISIIGKTLTPDIGTLPQVALENIVGIFTEFNFPPENRKSKAGASDDDSEDYELAYSVSFLVSQGHIESDIMAYPLPLFRLYAEVAADRLSGKVKKKEDPLEVFKKLGIPIYEGQVDGC